MIRIDQFIPVVIGIIALIILSWSGSQLIEELHPPDPTLYEGLFEGVIDLSGPLPTPIFLNILILIIIIVIIFGAMNILVKKQKESG
jgi:uncharacterized membrane protein